jgi:hypothetical protein
MNYTHWDIEEKRTQFSIIEFQISGEQEMSEREIYKNKDHG